MPGMIRAFIAIELPEPVLNALGQLGARLGRGEHRAAKWVSPSGIHLTLKFLGEVPTARLPEVTRGMAEAAAGSRPLALRLSGAGCFPSTERPRVVWVGLDGDLADLSRLQRSVEAAMLRQGFPPEGRGFTPHLTLARLRDTASPEDRRRIAAAVRDLAVPAVELVARDIALIRSELQPTGAVYTVLEAIPLGGR